MAHDSVVEFCLTNPMIFYLSLKNIVLIFMMFDNPGPA